MSIERNCPTCGASFRTYPSKLAQGRGVYCSRACNAKTNLLRHGATRHGLYGTPTYRTWLGVIQRCTNPNATKYWQYGERGIIVCDEWRSFQRFYDDMGLRPEGMTLDRIDGSKGYSKANCRWATPSEQQHNIKSNRWIDYQGERLLLNDVSKKLGVKSATLRYRIDRGWPQKLWGKRPWAGNRSHSLPV